MKKIVRQQNYLKELIDTQDNRYLTRQALECLVRSTLEPLLDAPESGVVLYRIDTLNKLKGLLKRLEFSEVESFSYSDKSDNLIEKVWANTEFVCVLTHRFVSILIWDNNTGDDNLVRFYSLYNSKLQYEPLNIIKRNSKVDISPYQEKYNPDRRDNILLNASIRRLLANLEEAANDAVLGYAEKSVENLKDSDYFTKKNRLVAHEIRNQLSICDLYTEIIKRQIEKDDFDRDSVKNAINAISKSIKMTNNSLLSLKTDDKVIIEQVLLSEVIQTSVDLGGVYLKDKDIELQVENQLELKVLADSEKLVAVIINLLKNASEAFQLDDITVQNGKYIKIKTEKNDSGVSIFVSNNAPGIIDVERIFYEGYTTKSSGSGLGLWICKKYIEEQMGELELSRTSEDYTEFAIHLQEA